MPMNIVISGNTPQHEEQVKEAFIRGFQSGGLLWNGLVTIDSEILSQAMIDRYPDCDMFIRSYTGFSGVVPLSLASPLKLIIMPVSDGDGTQELLYQGDVPAGPVLTGIGENENINDYKAEFFDIDPLYGQYISYSNGYIAGKLALIAKKRNCSARQARILAQQSASLYLSPNDRDGYGRIDLSRI